MRADKVTILGAGFSGLTLAHYLLQRGITVEVHERAPHAGGLLGSPRVGENFYETAANAVMGSPRAYALFTDLGLRPAAPARQARNRYIWRGRPRRWPLGPLETLGFLRTLLGRLLFSRAALKPRPFEDLRSWGARNLNPAAQHYLLETVLQGIYGAGIADLSATLVLGRFFKKGRVRTRGMLAPERGMQQLMEALEASLKARGAAIHYGSRGPDLPLDHPVALCMKAGEAAQALAQADPATAQALARVRMHDKTAVTVFYDAYPERYRGFGVLVPPGLPGVLPLGVLMNNYIFEGRGPAYNENWIFSVAGQDHLKGLDEAGTRAYLAEARERIFGERLPIREVRQTHWVPALPVYDVGLERVLAGLAPAPGIHLHGNWLGQLGLAAVLERSAALAQELADER